MTKTLNKTKREKNWIWRPCNVLGACQTETPLRNAYSSRRYQNMPSKEEIYRVISLTMMNVARTFDQRKAEKRQSWRKIRIMTRYNWSISETKDSSFTVSFVRVIFISFSFNVATSLSINLLSSDAFHASAQSIETLELEFMIRRSSSHSAKFSVASHPLVPHRSK